jgi:hypothetical protein
MDGVYFFDTAKVLYQFSNDKDKILTSKASFSFKNGLESPPLITAGSLFGYYFNTKPDSALLQKSQRQNSLYQSQLKLQKTKTLDAVVVTGKQKSIQQKTDEQYTSGLFAGTNAHIFTTEGDPAAQSAISILDYLRGKVAGLQITTNGQQGTITRRGSNTDVFLNEFPTDISLLQSTPMTDVAMIKVFDPPFIGAPGGGAGGAVAVYLKKGGGANTNVKGLNTATIVGYSSVKEFYMPNYEKTNSDAGDYRTTLYWNPFLLMDAKKRRVTIPFFNNDNCKKIKVVIEGINEIGQLTREEKIFE